MHYLVRAWKDSHYAETPTAELASENQLLRDFSLPYRWRRLDYVLKRLRELHSADPAVVARALTGAGLPPELPPGESSDATFLELRRGITAAEDALYAADRELASRDPEGLLASLELGSDDVASILGTPDDRAMQARAAAVLEKLGRDAFAAVTTQVAERIHEASRTSRDRIDAVLGPPTSTRDPAQATDLRSALTFALRFYYDAFEAFDAILYPLEFGTPIAETNAVEIRRISPLECERPHEARPEARALCGTSISHFGAFFELEWRKHDMLWGRLNASESIIRALVPEEHPQFEALIEEAQRAIVDDFVRDLDRRRTCPRGRGRGSSRRTTRRRSRRRGRRSPCSIAPPSCWARSSATPCPRRSRPAGGCLRRCCARTRAACRAVAHVLRAVVLGTLPGLVGLVAWLALVGAGIGLVVSDASVPLGVALLVLAALLAGALVIGLWLAISRLRAAIAKRVGTFVFGPP